MMGGRFAGVTAVPLVMLCTFSSPAGARTQSNAATVSSAGATRPAPLLARATQYWDRRKAKDLGGAYVFYCTAYKSRVSRDQYLQLTRLTRFDLTDVKVAADPEARGRAEVGVAYKYLFTPVSDKPLDGKTNEIWVQDGDGEWCKEDEPLVLPFPSGRGGSGSDVVVASAPMVIRQSDGTVSMTVSDVPLGQVLRAIARVSPFETLAIDPKAEARPVSVKVEAVPIEDALTVVLRNAGVNFVLAGTARLVVGDPTAAVDVQPVQTSQPVASPTGAEDALDQRRAESVSSPRPDQAVVQQVEPDHEGLERALVSPAGVPASQAGYAILPFPGSDGAPALVVLPPRGARPGAALPGLTPNLVLPQPSAPVPAELRPLLGVPVPKPSPPKK
jgi:hypothetical protein